MLDKLLKYSFILTLTVCILLFPELSAPAIRSGISLCITRVIPAIFPFLVLSGMISRSSAAFVAEDICAPAVRRMFGLPKCAATVLFTGYLCGFPVGAKTAADMFRAGRLTKKQTEYLLMFCNNTGPSFVIGAVGIDILLSVRLGIALYVFQVLSSILCGIILKSTVPRTESETSAPEKREPTPRFSSLLCSSVLSGVRSLTAICGFVIFFAFIVSLIELPVRSFTDRPEIISALSGVFELTRGIYSLEGVNAKAAFVIAGGLISWSGFSVHFQTAALLSQSGLSMRRYIIGKALCCAVNLSLCCIFAIIAL